MVSVSLLTYQQKDYVKQCLDGILSQQVDFPIEVIVGDDASKDGTQDILREYGEKYPHIFQMILREKNIGAPKNLYDVLEHCRGKYIAGLEGDDYWFDPHKLQTQVDFLEAHLEYIGCSHEVTMIDETGKELYQNSKYIEGRHWTFYRSIFTYDEDYKNFRLPGQGSTYLYRNVFLEKKYDYSIIANASPMVGDMTLLLILSSQGDWYFMQGKSMTCYRFVTIKGKDNWASWVSTKNRTYVDFQYRKNLEDYAHNVLHKSLDLCQQKFELFYEAHRKARNEPSDENKEIFRQICKIASPFWYYWGRLYIKKILDCKILSTIQYASQQGEFVCDNPRFAGQTWQDFDKAICGKTIVAFGAGVSFDEFLQKYRKQYDIPCIMDNNQKRWGATLFYYESLEECCEEKYESIHVISPDSIREWDKDKFVILITSTLYWKAIAKQLEDMDFHNYYVMGIMESKLWWYKIGDFYERRILRKGNIQRGKD